jgi:hypothetical protein
VAQSIRSLAQTELSQDFFLRDAFTTSERSAGAVERRSRLRRDFFLFYRCQSERDSGSITSRRLRTTFTFPADSMSSSAWACWRS